MDLTEKAAEFKAVLLVDRQFKATYHKLTPFFEAILSPLVLSCFEIRRRRSGIVCAIEMRGA